MTRYQAMQDVIDMAWSNPTPEEKALQMQLFPEGKPSPFVFVERVSSFIQLQNKYGL